MATYFVRPDGNNANAGNGPATNQAWATITKAAQTMVAGDSVWIAPGTYRESVAPTNAGSSGNLISFKGNPSASQFPGVTPGEVVINGQTSDSAANSTNAVLSSVKAYIGICDMRLTRMAYGLTLGDGCELKRLKIHMSIPAQTGTAIWLAGYSILVEDCITEGAEIAVQKNVNKYGTFRRCVLQGTSSRAVVYNSGGTFTLEFCIVKGFIYSTGSANMGGSVNIAGCYMEQGIAYGSTPSSVIYDAAASDTSLSRNFMGSHMKGYGQIISGANSSGTYPNIQGCVLDQLTSEGVSSIYVQYAGRIHWKDSVGAAYYQAWGAPSHSNFDFENCFKCMDIPAGITVTISNFRVDVVRGGTFKTGAGTLNGTPTYGKFERGVGTIVTATNPISGAKSLKMMGYGYAPPFVQQVGCEAGKAKTVKVKVKLSSASDSVTVSLGDQQISAAANTNVQTLTVTYTSGVTEFVPLWICGKPSTTLDSYVLIDDIAA